MARRKGISSNATSKSRNPPEQTSAHDKPTQPNGILHDADNKRTETMPPAQEKPRFEYTFTNNNDHKYLHKKFKKMASSGPIAEDQNSSSEQLQSKQYNSTQGLSDNNVTFPPHTQIELISYRQKDNLTTELGSKESHRERANNVQINLKEICNSNDIAISVKGLNDIGNSDEKLTRKTDNYETDVPNAKETMNGGVSGRYVCPYCKLVCTKPSVLQKHIRAHTNERPYPCVPCGFAFKTKSNLYKHCRSRTHALRLQGGENGVPNNEDDWSPDSESDTSLPAAALSDTNTGSDSVSLIMTDSTRVADISSPELATINEGVSTGSSTPQPATSTEGNKPKTIYKPKFHKASFYQDEEERSRKLFSSNPEFLNQHIAKIISDNEAIVETIDSPLQKKYGKITNLQKQIASSFENSSTTFESNKSEPLNLTKQGSSSDSEVNQRKRSYSESFTQPDLQKLPQHPLNPEGSIIKDLLLKARAQARGLLPVTSENYDESEPLFVCPLCQISYRSADNLEIHRLYYCKGNNNQSNVVSSTSSSKDTFKSYRPEHIYTRSNSINVTLQETYSPNSLAKLATSTLKVPHNRSNKPEQLVIVKPENNDIAAPLPSPGPLLGNTRLVDTRGTQEFNRNLYRASESNLKNKSIPSPKRRQELMRSDSFNTSPRLSDDSSQRSELYSPQTKVRCVEPKPTTLRSLEELSLSPMRQNSASLQMFGGEVKILDNSGSTTTLRIEHARNNLSPTLIHERSSPSRGGGETETSSVVVRSGLHSGGTMIHTPRETTPSPHPQTPRIKVSITPNISTPNLTVTGIPAPNITQFQFPPLGVITGFNPLTLPPLSPSASINGATTILHGGKLIPHVPGMPGPNTPYVSTTMTQPKYAQSKDLLSPFSNSKEDPFYRISVAKSKSSHQQVETKMSVSRPNSRSPMRLSSVQDVDKVQTEGHKHSLITIQEQKTIPIIKISNTENTRVTTINGVCTMSVRSKSVKNEDVKSRHNDLLQINTSRLKDSELRKINNTDNATSFEANSENRVVIVSPDPEIRRFNFENLISKSEIYNNTSSILISGENSRLNSLQEPLTISVTSFERSETSYFQKNINAKGLKEDTKSRFLRPSSLPLKPGTFTPKKHHGITPTANTMPLISPETPRPAKAYGQLYLNGHAYTYLGLKCSTKAYYCTLNRPQPTYVPNQHSLSMYSNWQICSEATPHPLGLSAGHAMALYDSRHRPQNMIVSTIKQDYILTHSSQWKNHSNEQKDIPALQDADKADKQSIMDINSSKNKELAGGFESNEAYTYVRGRGRGRYVCSECGIRCKKPSMLKKHIRTHTDVRPYTCKHCAFSFKTKGNLTKHMKSKSHYKKCCELGINPNEDMEGGELNQGSGETDDDSDSDGDDGNEGETESSDTDSWKSRLPEHEAAHCLLSLWGTRPSSTATPGLLTSARPTTYPYTPSGTEEPTVQTNYQANTKFPSAPGAKPELFGESMEVDHNEPMDLSRNEIKVNSIEEIVSPVKESTVLASLASSAAKLPQQQNHWTAGEPMLHAYITERALQDSKIKQSQYTLSKLRKLEISKTNQKEVTLSNDYMHTAIPSSSETVTESVITSQSRGREKIVNDLDVNDLETSDNTGIDTLADVAANSARLASGIADGQRFIITSGTSDINTRTENAKFVASEYLKMASGKSNTEKVYDKITDKNERYEETVKHGAIDLEEIESRDMKEAKETETSKMHVDHEPIARKVVIGAGGVAFEVTSKNSDRFQTTAALAPGRLTEDGRSVCVVCNKSFSKPSQLRLHINIHYMERPFRCGACAVSFRTRGHLQKHERSGSHHTKVSMTSAFGAATSANPRPFKCSDCKIAFRIHGHLAKHLRSKMHVMRLECLGKLPFGTFAEIERAGVSLTDIDTTDCANSLASLQLLAQKLHEKDPTKLESWDPATMVPPLLPAGRESSDEEETAPDRKPPDAPPSSDLRSFSRLDAARHSEDSRIKYSATDT